MTTNTISREKRIFLRQWVDERVSVVTVNGLKYEGLLSNIAFDGSRLMYIMLDDQVAINFEHIVEVRVEK